MTGVTWHLGRPPVDREVVKKVEAALGVRFPDDFVEYAMQHHGGQPRPCCLDFGGRNEKVFGALLPFSAGPELTLLQEYASVKDRLPKRVIPFAVDPGGSLFCFDYRDGPAPTIVYWDHDKSVSDLDESVTPVAASFTRLLELLHE